MQNIARIVKTWMQSLLILTLVLLVAGCGVTKIFSGFEPLPTVSALTPPQLPNWIEQISPTGEAQPLNQIRIRFKEPLSPIESLDNPEQQRILQLFEILPPLPGHFQFLTPRMVGFQADKALPLATRVRVTLKAGLADLKNHRLDRDLAWTFNIESIKLSNLPTTNPQDADTQPIDLNPTLKFTSNVELDLASVEKHCTLIPEGFQKKSVPLKIALEKQEEKSEQKEKSESEQPQDKFEPSTKNWNYTITPQPTLEKATRYRLEFSPGLRPASGNLPSETAFVRQVATYSPLQFQGIKFSGQPDASGTYGRFVKGSPQLQFTNQIVADSALQNITVNPTPKQTTKLVQADDGQNIVSLNPYILEPATTYTITLGANLKDKFGQTLGKPVTVQYNTGDVAGNIWAPSGLNIFPSGKDLQLNITTVNLPDSNYKAAYRVVQPTDLVYVDSAYLTEENNILPNPTSWQSFQVSGKKNQSADVIVPLREKLGAKTGMLAYGVQAQTNSYQENGKSLWREPKIYGMVQLTNLGVFAQWFPESGLIRVHHLSDGSAAAADVEIYESNPNSPLSQGGVRGGSKSGSPLSQGGVRGGSNPNSPLSQGGVRGGSKPCATGKSDRTGTLILTRQNLQQCIKSTSGFEQAPKLLVIARENQDWAFARTDESSGAYGYGVYADWDNGKPQSRGVIFSDRQLYQPGEKAWFTGFAYYLQNGTLSQDVPRQSRGNEGTQSRGNEGTQSRGNEGSYKVTLFSPDNQTTDLGTQTTNEFGTFALELPLKNNQPLGYYSIRAKGKNGAEISGEFRVAEFKPPNFKVALALDKEFALINDKVEAKSQSDYLFGSPVEGGKAQYYVTRQQNTFIPKGWEQFSFGRQWFWPEEPPTVQGDVLQSKQVLDVGGKSNQIVTVAGDLPYPMTYRVDAQVADVSNLSVSDSKTFTALPSAKLIGLQSNFVADAGKPFPVQVIVTDYTGKVIENQPLRVELQQIKYSSVTRLVEGSQTAKNQVEYKTVGQVDVQSGSSAQTVSLTAPSSGSYRIRANFLKSSFLGLKTEPENEVSATDLQVWVSGDNPVVWGSREGANLEIKLDKKSYKPGETATALIQSPYPEAELYFAVVRDKPFYKNITKVKGGAPQIKFTVTPEMLPNAAVQAVLVRQGVSINQVQPGSLDNLARIGFVPFNVNLDDKYLKVQVTPGQAKLSPGAEQTVQLELKNAQGSPIGGQFTVMVVNEAVLQLSGYRPPDLVKTIYAEQPISTRFSDNRANVVLEKISSPQPKGWGYGGGFSAAAANTRIRKDFQPLAYYNGSILTDSTGKAQVKFKLPDDLTTWRIMAVATGKDLRFGNGEATFITTKPLLSNPILPQFARKGDRFQVGLSITNNTGQTGNLAINGSLGGALQFADNNPGSLQTQSESGTRAYRFPIVANSTGKANIKFTSQLNGTADAFEVPLEVKPLEITEQVIETGTTSDRAKIPLNVGGVPRQSRVPRQSQGTSVVVDAGGLEVSLASTLIPEITAPARQVLEDEQLPFLEPAASQLAIAANLSSLSTSPLLKGGRGGSSDFNPTQQAESALERLQKLQMPDGGFASYPGEKTSDPKVTPYAAQSLARARKAFPNLVDAGMVSRLTAYLKKILALPGQYDFCKTQLCKNQVRLEALTVLAELGEKRNDFLAEIYSQRDLFDTVTQIKLTRYLSQFPEWQSQSKSLFDRLQQNINETGRAATLVPNGWKWMSSPTATQAQALRMAIASLPGSPLLKGGWGGSTASGGGGGRTPELVDRLLQGLLALRRDGTWQTTYDNAEALTALVEYSKLQSVPPNFAAKVQLAGKNLASTKFQGYRNPNLEVNVPMASLPRGRHDLILQKSGKGTLHYLVAYRYRLQGNQPGRFNGLRVVREIRRVGEEKVLRKLSLYATDSPLTLETGQVYDVGLEIITDHPVERVVITEPLPAGLEVIDSSLQTATPSLQAQGDSWQVGFKNIYRDAEAAARLRVVAYGDRLEPGVYSLHYLVRSVTPGTFLWPGAEVHLQYAPEEFGRSADSTLVLNSPS